MGFKERCYDSNERKLTISEEHFGYSSFYVCINKLKIQFSVILLTQNEDNSLRCSHVIKNGKKGIKSIYYRYCTKCLYRFW